MPICPDAWRDIRTVPQLRFDILDYNLYRELTYWRREQFRNDGQRLSVFAGDPPEHWTCNACGGALELDGPEGPGVLGIVSGSGIPACTHDGCPTAGWDRVRPTERL